MNKPISVLIVEDHPLTASAYQSAFEHLTSNNPEFDFDVEIAYDLVPTKR